MSIKDKYAWIEDQLGQNTILWFYTEDFNMVNLTNVTLYEGATDDDDDELVANGYLITHVSIYGYNPSYEKHMRYPVWNDAVSHLCERSLK